MVRPHAVKRSKKCSVKQQQEWYEILKQDGFIDIELFDPVNGRARLHLSTKGTVTGVELTEESEQHGVVLDPEGKMQYYELAGDLNNIKLDDGYHVFKSYDDQRIWYYHSQGLPSTKIAKKLDLHERTIRRRIEKYKPMLSNKLLLPSVKEVNTVSDFRYSEDSEYEVVDYCKDPLKTTEDVMIKRIERERAGIRTREVGYYEDIEEDLRNKYTGYRLIERLVELDDEQTEDSFRVRYTDPEHQEGIPVNNNRVIEYTIPDQGKSFHSM